MWTLDKALEYIRTRQPDVMANGYYIALAGGVLNNGQSSNDLDLVAVPRTDGAFHASVIWFFGNILAASRVPGGIHYTFENHVEVLFVDGGHP